MAQGRGKRGGDYKLLEGEGQATQGKNVPQTAAKVEKV